jgi:phospholipid/cholesterol/gamma-HCH transport system substrate-binding protein
MNTNKHYILVGIFMIIGVVAMVFIGIWLSFGLNNVKLNNYIAIFKEPVDGLTMNASVKFNGVSIGNVIKIEIDTNSPGNTIVTLAIQEGTPITTNTYATLKPQGITGLSYIGLQTDSKKLSKKLVEPSNAPPYPTIPTKPSLFNNISKQLSDVTTNIDKTAKNISSMFSKQNFDHVHNILANVDSITKNIADNNEKITQSIVSIEKLLSIFASNSKKYNKLMANLTQTSNSIAQTSAELYLISEKFNNQTLPGINQSLLPNINQSMKNFNAATIELDQLLKTLNLNPSALVRGTSAPLRGPGE